MQSGNFSRGIEFVNWATWALGELKGAKKARGYLPADPRQIQVSMCNK